MSDLVKDQILALHAQDFTVEQIATEMGVAPLVVKTVLPQGSKSPTDTDDGSFTDEDRRLARRVIKAIASGGGDVDAGTQLKAATYIHSGGRGANVAGGLTIGQLNEQIQRAQQSFWNVVPPSPHPAGTTEILNTKT